MRWHTQMSRVCLESRLPIWDGASVWRGRIYAIRFFLIFTMAGPAAWGIGWLYTHGGFDVVLGVGVVIAVLGALNTFAISALVTGVENQRVRAEARQAATVVQPAE